MKNKNAFTLVELLAVIVILAVILVIAVPKVISIIDDTKKGTLESTAKMIASSAEKAKVQSQVLGKDIEITCDSVVKLNNVDYERCNIEFIDNKAYVDIKGSGKFENMYVCKGTKDEAHIVNRCINEKVHIELVLDTDEEYNDLSGIYKEGDVIYLDTPTKTGFLFIRWEVVSGDSVIENDNKLTVGEYDTIVHAVWENNPLFEVNLEGGEDNVEYEKRYQTRTTIELEVPTKTNYKFIRWEKVLGDGVLSGNTYTMGTEDTVIRAVWELNVFNLTVELNGGTTTQEFKAEYAIGETITLESPTRENYTFKGWTVTNGTIEDDVFTMGVGDVILTAIWEIIDAVPIFTYSGSYQIVDDNDNVITQTKGNWKIRFLTSGTLRFTSLNGAENGIDVFLVGGGGGGAPGAHGCCGGGGGGGGYATTVRKIEINANQDYEIKIGGGGGRGGGRGGTSSAFDYTAEGGYGGGRPNGGSGGNAGGKGAPSPASGSYGSLDTREFGEENGKYYAGGGGGGGPYNSGNGGGAGGGGAGGGGRGGIVANIKNGVGGSTNTGGGGGGGVENDPNDGQGKGADGGSGIVIIRNIR